MRFLGDNRTPVITRFRIGTTVGPATLDTGSNGLVSLYDATVLRNSAVKAALAPAGSASYAGARGTASARTFSLALPIGIEPFMLPPGQVVSLRPDDPSARGSRANIGNRFFAALQLKVLLDYKGRRMKLFGNCGD